MKRWKKFNNPVLIQPTREVPAWLGIVGAEDAGAELACFLGAAFADVKLVLVDPREELLETAIARINSEVEKENSDGMTGEDVVPVMERLLVSTDFHALAYCDWVIESLDEDIAVKREGLARIEEVVGERTIISSNTGFIPAQRLFSQLQHPGRATVTHFHDPAAINGAVELVNWDSADGFVIQYLRWLLCIIGKVPLLSRDAVGFTLQRVMYNWCNEAAALLTVASVAQIDDIAGRFSEPGAFAALSRAGASRLCHQALCLMAESEGDHYRPLFAADREFAGECGTGENAVPASAEMQQEITDRLLGTLFSQSIDLLDREIATASDLDAGMRLAYGFSKGPLELMHDLGDQECRRILASHKRNNPAMSTTGRHLSTDTGDYCYLLLDELEGVKIITMRRPETANALHGAMCEEILAVLRQFENDPGITGFVISGYGKHAFSNGTGVREYLDMLGKREDALAFAEKRSTLYSYLDACVKPVVAALNGRTLGSGLELAVRCHGIVSVKDAWMQFPEITMGILPGLGGLVVPYRRWPDAAAVFHKMLIRAEKLEAEKAAEIGMINTLVDKQMNLVPAGVWLTKDLVDREEQIRNNTVKIAPIIREVNAPLSIDGYALSPSLIEVMCDTISAAAAAGTYRQGLEIASHAFAESICMAASKEGISAWAEGRLPDFRKTG